MSKRRSFFEKLTGAVRLDDESPLDRDIPQHDHISHKLKVDEEEASHKPAWNEEPSEGELTVDVYQTPTHVVIKTMIAGVRPDDIEVSITRDMVTIKGKREDEREIHEENYYHRELYWGSFSRSVVLPQEVEPDEAEASERHGLLVIRIPKIDRARQARVKVKSN